MIAAILTGLAIVAAILFAVALASANHDTHSRKQFDREHE